MFVGGTCVFVGGTGVLVGGTGVLVGGRGVFVGGGDVCVAVRVAVASLYVRCERAMESVRKEASEHTPESGCPMRIRDNRSEIQFVSFERRNET